MGPLSNYLWLWGEIYNTGIVGCSISTNTMQTRSSRYSCTEDSPLTKLGFWTFDWYHHIWQSYCCLRNNLAAGRCTRSAFEKWEFFATNLKHFSIQNMYLYFCRKIHSKDAVIIIVSPTQFHVEALLTRRLAWIVIIFLLTLYVTSHSIWHLAAQ